MTTPCSAPRRAQAATGQPPHPRLSLPAQRDLSLQRMRRRHDRPPQRAPQAAPTNTSSAGTASPPAIRETFVMAELAVHQPLVETTLPPSIDKRRDRHHKPNSNASAQPSACRKRHRLDAAYADGTLTYDRYKTQLERIRRETQVTEADRAAPSSQSQTADAHDWRIRLEELRDHGLVMLASGDRTKSQRLASPPRSHPLLSRPIHPHRNRLTTLELPVLIKTQNGQTPKRSASTCPTSGAPRRCAASSSTQKHP